MSFNPSKYQQAIFDYIDKSTEPLVVQALAGSGKTTSLLECAKRLPQYEKAIFVAFNKHIADHLGNKLFGTPMQAQTLHSVGYRILAKELDGRLEVDSRKYYKLAKDKLEKERYFEFFDRTRNRLNDDGYELVLALSDLIGFIQKTNSFDIKRIIRHYGLPTVLYTFMHTERTVRELIAEGERIARNERRVDYNEMIWLPLRWRLQVPTYDTVFVDECQDLSATQLELALRTSNGGRKVYVGDKHQCVIEGTLIDGIPVEEIKKGDKIIAACGRSNTREATITDIFYKEVKNYPVVSIVTKTGKCLTTTMEHIHFAGYMHDKGEYAPFFTYLMYKEGYGYRVGVTRKYRYGNNKRNNLGYKTRTSQEHADKLWLLKANDTESKARYWESYYAALYGLPTIMFKTVDGSAFAQEDIDSIFTQLPTKTHAIRLMRDLWLNYEYPHHTPKCMTETRRRNFSITLCSDSRSSVIYHKYEMGGNNTEDEKLLRSLGIKVTDNGKNTGWRVHKVTPNIKEIYDTLKLIQDHTDINVIQTASLSKGTSLPFTPASHILPGMMVFVKNDDKIEYEEVVWIKHHTYTGKIYDLNVDAVHNYPANGIITHNSIYGFAGAANDSVDRIVKRTNANELPLSICYRCDGDILALAREVVPHIEAREGAGKGLVKNIVPGAVIHMAREGDLILSRKTAPLISTCLDFIGNGIPARVKGRDIGKQLTSIVKKTMKVNGYNWDQFLFYLTEYEQNEIDMLIKRDATPAHIESVQDRIAAVRVCYATMKPVDEEDMCRKIEDLFDDNRQMIELSTVHRAKGLEADRVFIIDAASLPLPLGGWQEQQEWNLRYVAVTRAKHELYIEGDFIPGPYANNVALPASDMHTLKKELDKTAIKHDIIDPDVVDRINATPAEELVNQLKTMAFDLD